MFADILIILLIRYTGFLSFLINMRVYKLFKSFFFAIAAFA